MEDFQVLVGGKAGDGINSAGLTVAYLLNRLGYSIYMYFDYPSLIKGGHNFTIVRAAGEKIGAHRTGVDFILALNPDTVRLHTARIGPGTVIVYDADTVTASGIGVPVEEILAAEKAPAIMTNTCIIGAFARAAGIGWDVVVEVLSAHIPKETARNLAVAKRAFEGAEVRREIPPAGGASRPLLTGNEAIGLGLIEGGLDAYVAYPMTPTSNLLHFLAESASKTGLTVVHPESEIAVMLMALGLAYGGKRAAVGTSGGGFCLMNEGFSMAGQAELPVLVVLGQRTGPSTGLPTYSAQSDLHFALHAGQGEFPRLVAAPGNLEQAYYWASAGLQLAWKYQVPAILLVDKNLCEGTYSMELPEPARIPAGSETPVMPYRRYAETRSGISPLLFPPAPGAMIKVNSYAHDESGTTTEDPALVEQAVEKRRRKEEGLARELEGFPAVDVAGDRDAPVSLLCWGSTREVCREVGILRSLRVIQPVVLSPFPEVQFRNAVAGVERLIAVEENASGQLSLLLKRNGFNTDAQVLRYNGRPFAVDELDSRIEEVIA
jgi:2-oxoglutarate ferredoxin oxidoreductase subunit alpha